MNQYNKLLILKYLNKDPLKEQKFGGGIEINGEGKKFCTL
jgi:hypothetical protein